MSTYDVLCEQKYSHDIELASSAKGRLYARFAVDGGWSVRFYVRRTNLRTTDDVKTRVREFDSWKRQRA